MGLGTVFKVSSCPPDAYNPSASAHKTPPIPYLVKMLEMV